MKHIFHYTKATFDFIKKNRWLLFIIFPAFLIHLLIIFPSGSYYCFKDKCGIFFWGAHSHDAIWHLAIANTAFNKTPFQMPTFAGIPLFGYNYLLDLIIYLLSKLMIPPIISYFKILPIIWFVFYTMLLIIVARKIKNSPIFVGLLLFFFYFSESFSYLLRLLHSGTIWGAAGLLTNLKIHMMLNLPFAFSVLILLTILILIQDKKVNFKKILFIGFLNFLNLGLKFYGGIITIFLTFIYIFLISFNRNWGKLFLYLLVNIIFLTAAIFVFYDPLTSFKSGSIFTFSPFALIHTITEEKDLFYLRDLTNARYYLITKGIGPRLILIELFNLITFLFFYLGVKFFGPIYAVYKLFRKKFTIFDWHIFLTIIFSTFLTTTFVQKGQWWNIVQFFCYTIFLSSIFIAQLVYEFIRKKTILTSLAVGFLIILAIPVDLDIIKNSIFSPPVSYVSEEEIEALFFLKEQPEGVVLTPLYNKALKDNVAPNEMYRYEDTAYVSAFSGKVVYLANVTQLELTGVNYEQRLKKIQNNDCWVLDEVDYIYEIKSLPNMKNFLSCRSKNIKRIFSNEKVNIYKIK